MAAPSEKRCRRRLIINHWIRILKSPSISTDDIAKLIIDFGNDYEAFDPKISSKDIKFSEDNLTISKRKGFGRSAYGTIHAISGGKYHWKLKMIEECPLSYIGLIEADHCAPDQRHWIDGFSYYYGGGIYEYGMKTDCKDIGAGAGDIVEMYLDLRDENTLKYMLNGQDLGTIPCDTGSNKNVIYKLAFGFYNSGRVSLMSFESE